MSRRSRQAAYTGLATAATSEGPTGFGRRIASLPGLVRDTMNGRYEGLGRGRLAMMAIAVVYIVSPVDLLPEALLTLPGMMDDAAIAAWLIASLMGATAAYQAWGNGADASGMSSEWSADLGGAEPQSAPSPSAGRVVAGEVIYP